MEKYTDPKTDTYTLIEFQAKYGTEKDCEQALFHLKWPKGFQCPKCGSRRFIQVRGRRLPLYQCSQCRRQTTSTTGTISIDTQKYDPKSSSKRLKWLHVMISNIKANIKGAYHGLDGTYLSAILTSSVIVSIEGTAGCSYLLFGKMLCMSTL